MGGRRGGNRALFAAVGVLTVLALALRLRMAGGALWLDEIASLRFAMEGGAAGMLVPHDNNHPFNTLWLSMVGADAPTTLQRGLSIALGTAAVPLAAALARPRGAVAALVAALGFAICWPLVVYGSEARGYAGFVFATLLLMLGVDRHGASAPAWAPWAAAGAAALGLGFHALTVFSGVAAGVAALWMNAARGEGADAAVRRTLRFLGPAMATGGVLVGLAALQAARAGGVSFGGVVPFSPERFAAGYTGLLAWTLGLPAAVPPAGSAVLAVAVLAALAVLAPTRRDLPMAAAGVLAAPAAMLALMPPNTEFPRYHLVAGIALLFAVAAVAAGLARRGTGGRLAAGVLVMLFAAGHAAALADFDRLRRGDLPGLLAAGAVGLDAPVRVGSDRDQRTPLLLEYAAKRTGIAFEPVSAADACTAPPPPLLLLSVDLAGPWSPLHWPGPPADPPTRIGDRPAGCPAPYDLVGVDRVSPISGLPLALFRRSDRP